jgi:hypothetical protein
MKPKFSTAAILLLLASLLIIGVGIGYAVKRFSPEMTDAVRVPITRRRARKLATEGQFLPELLISIGA